MHKHNRQDSYGIANTIAVHVLKVKDVFNSQWVSFVDPVNLYRSNNIHIIFDRGNISSNPSVIGECEKV